MVLDIFPSRQNASGQHRDASAFGHYFLTIASLPLFSGALYIQKPTSEFKLWTRVFSVQKILGNYFLAYFR